MKDHSMEEHPVRILASEKITHNVRRFKLSKPGSYSFKPGQATDIVINLPQWKSERRPFTFTSLNDWDHLEFTIKIYSDHGGVTSQLGKLKVGDELILHDVFGAINYKGEGVFIAGGAGITPFIAILRQLQKDGKLGNNQLIFSNKTAKDIILKDEFKKMLGDNFVNTLTEEKAKGCDNTRINTAYLKRKIRDLSGHCYVCGPPPLIDSVCKSLEKLGVDKNRIVMDRF